MMGYFICVYLMISAYAIGAASWHGQGNKPTPSMLKQIAFLPIAPILLIYALIVTFKDDGPKGGE